MPNTDCETCQFKKGEGCGIAQPGETKADVIAVYAGLGGCYRRSLDLPESPPFFVSYQGLDERESLDEYLYDIGMTESDYVGWDVGAQ